LADVVELDTDVLHIWVANVVLCQCVGSVIVAMDRSKRRGGEAEACEKRAEEGNLVGCVM